MNFTIGSAEFTRLLAAPAHVAGAALRITVNDAMLAVTADNGEVRIERRVPVADGTDGQITVPAALFHSIAKVMPHGPVTVDAASPTIVEITGDGSDDDPGPARASVWQINDPDATVIPREPDQPASIGDINIAQFRRAMRQVLPAVSNDYQRPVLTAVSVRSIDGRLSIAASDSYRLHATETDMVDAAGWSRPALIPGAAIRLALDLFTEDEPVDLRLDSRLMVMASPTTVFTARLIRGSFPDYMRLLRPAAPSATRVQTDAAALLAGLARVAPIARQGGHHVWLTAIPEDSIIVVESSADDLGTATASVKADVRGAAFRFGAHHGYLTEAVKAAAAQRVDIVCADDRDPLTISGFGDPYKAVVNRHRKVPHA